MSKLLAISLISWLAALVAFASTAWLSGRASTQDVVSIGFWGGLAAVTATAVYTPVMFTLRRRVRNVWVYIGIGAGLAAVPVVVLAALLGSLGGLLSGMAALFLGIFMVFGVCFGVGFFWAYVRPSS